VERLPGIEGLTKTGERGVQGGQERWVNYLAERTRKQKKDKHTKAKELSWAFERGGESLGRYLVKEPFRGLAVETWRM